MNSTNRVRHGQDLTKEQKYRKIWELVKKHGFSQKEACEVYDINEKTFSAWKIRMERGMVSLSSVKRDVTPQLVKKEEVTDIRHILVRGEDRNLYPKYGTIRYNHNWKNIPFRVHPTIGGALILEGADTTKKFDRDLKESGLLMHQLVSGLIYDLYAIRDHITPESVKRIKEAISHGKNGKKK